VHQAEQATAECVTAIRASCHPCTPLQLGEHQGTRPIGDMVSILPAGKNVVSCSGVPLVFPDAIDAAFTDPLREAALAGGVSFFTTGIDSGFANDVLPLVLSGISRVIDTVRATEIFNYATYPDKSAVYEILGFGKPPEATAFAATPGVFTFGWGPVLHQLTSGLGVQIDHIDESVQRVAAEQSFDTPTGRIAAGTIAAMRSMLTEFASGTTAFVIDQVTRMHDDIAPDWPQPHVAIPPRDLTTAVRRAAAFTASRSKAHRACGASWNWPTTTTLVRAWRAHRGCSTPFPRCAPPYLASSPRWTCR
jgi:hypothetical protein